MGLDQEQVQSYRRLPSQQDILVAILLLLTMLAGGYLRFMGNNWDDFVHFHPDERYLAGVATSLGRPLSLSSNHADIYAECLERYPDTDGRGGYFDADCSPYNPENVVQTQYVYGTLPLFTARFVADIVVEQTGDPTWRSYDGIHRVWRAVNAAADTLAILFVFLIGMRLHNKWAGLVAAILYAASVLPIQLAHFGTTDVMTSLFVVIALYFAVRTQDTGGLLDYVGFGLALGAAVASRVNVAPLAGVIVVVAALHITPMFDSRLAWAERNRLLTHHFAGLVLAACASFIVFRIANPYAFSGPGILGIWPYERFIDALSQSRYMVSGAADWAPNWQWLNRTPYLFSFQNIILWGTGVALGITAWFAWGLSGWRLLFGYPKATRHISLFAWILGYFAFTGGLWVMSMRYYLPLYPAFAVFAAWMLVDLVQHAQKYKKLAWGFATLVVGFTILWALMFTNIYRSMATFTQASHWAWENLPGDFYMQLDDSVEDAPLINIPIWNLRVATDIAIENRFLAEASRIAAGVPIDVQFVAPATGTISRVYANRLGDPDDLNEERTIEVTLTAVSGSSVVAVGQLTATFERGDHFIGQPYVIELDTPFVVEEGETYNFHLELASDGVLVSAGTIMLNEPWDESMPAKVCTLPAGVTLADNPSSGLNTAQDCNGRDVWHGLFNGYTMELHWEDVPAKRDQMQVLLDQTDTIIIGTNRRYDSQSRNPYRWPLTNRYYEALFNGELGFDLIATFQETFELGPLKVSDQNLPTYDTPDWINEFEPEEAFHVYDHPVVFIFQKNEHYASDNTLAILHSVELNRVGSVFGGYNNPTLTHVMERASLAADSAPSALMFTDDMQERQTTGGTWSDRFNASSLLSENHVFAALVWWLVIVIFGWVMWPLLFMAFPVLSDRGFGLSKYLSMMLIGWGLWVLATLRLPVWSRWGVLLGLLFLLVISAYIVSKNRRTFLVYLLARRRMLLWQEVIAFVLYLVMIGVRLTNPDLWHNTFGGEKPMDFAYFNGVLRSTIFPPIDPWFADGYINYYYFGYVTVGVPTLLLGITPSVAYNLIVPTLFSLTGVAAFSTAFNVSSGWQTTDYEYVPSDDGDRLVKKSVRRSMGNPWVAGIAALLLTVIVGNLDTVRVFGNGVAKLSGYEQPTGLNDFLVDEYVDKYGVPPDETTLFGLNQRAANNDLNDRVRYEISKTISLFTGLTKGFGELLKGKELYISPERWFWGPTRVITEIPNAYDGAINEMPFFTFLYGDLHAHMIAMPMMLIAMTFVYAELMAAGQDRRKVIWQVVALVIGGITVGLFQPTNTWDYPTFTILGVAGLGYAWWISKGRIGRWSLMQLVGRVGGFIAIGVVAALPFTWWFASGITQFKIWEGKKTPLWAYLDIHGLFIFLIISLLIWETSRWFRSVKVAELRGRFQSLSVMMIVIAATGLITLIVGVFMYQVALVVIPLIVWIVFLFFRSDQSRPMQFILVLAGLALAITFGTEIVTLANDNGRQNTIFKFYMQVWLLFGVVGGVGFAWIISHTLRWSAGLAFVWYLVLAALFFIAMMYPLMAIRGKAFFRFEDDMPLTLDGMDYMLYTSHWESGITNPVELKTDYQVIRWLQDNVEGSPVIIEAISDRILYQWGGRISIYTGLPSVVGWDYHQRQQRSLEPLSQMVSQRIANVNAFYTTPFVLDAVNILRHYDVGYVIVSNYEYERYNETGGLEKFELMVQDGLLTPVYEIDTAVIYAVNQDMVFEMWATTLIAESESGLDG